VVTGAEMGGGREGKREEGQNVDIDIDVDVDADADTRREQGRGDASRSQAHMSFNHPPLSKRLLAKQKPT
jgi:hypothetical protein